VLDRRCDVDAAAGDRREKVVAAACAPAANGGRLGTYQTDDVIDELEEVKLLISG